MGKHFIVTKLVTRNSVRQFCITILGHGHSRRDGHRAIRFKPRHVALIVVA
jgi:hypothetical protein